MFSMDIKQFKVGDNFWARGKENATTGYRWQVALDPTGECGEDAFIMEDQYTLDAHPKGWVGGGGIRTFKFEVTEKALANKYCQVGFTMDQPWMLGKDWKTSPQKSFTLTIN